MTSQYRHGKTFQKKCPECDYQTGDKSNLKRHVVLRHSHTTSNIKTETYKCYDCGFETKLKQNLKVHIFHRHRLKEDDDSKGKDMAINAIL